jgi:hypothetical protein
VGDKYCEYACQPKAPSTTPTSTFFKGVSLLVQRESNAQAQRGAA